MTVLKERHSFISLEKKISSVLFLPDEHFPCPAFIMCHGAMDFKENYFEFCEFLAKKGIAALAMDMHGHGESEGGRYHVVMEEWVADIRAALFLLQSHSRIHGKKIGAFGVSSGGTAVLECSLVEPGLKALVTLDATVRPVFSLPDRIMLKVLNFVGGIKKTLTGTELRVSLVSSCRSKEVANDPAVNAAWVGNPKVIEMWSSFPFPGFEDSTFVDTIKRVHDIKVPTLVLHGALDKLDSPETARMLYASLTCPKGLHIIEGNGHLGHMDRNRHMVMDLTTRWAEKHLP